VSGTGVAKRSALELSPAHSVIPPLWLQPRAGFPFKARVTRAAPMRTQGGLRKLLRESARRDFEPLAPNYLKLR
jgi:hypothetical protein